MVSVRPGSSSRPAVALIGVALGPASQGCWEEKKRGKTPGRKGGLGTGKTETLLGEHAGNVPRVELQLSKLSIYCSFLTTCSVN